MKINIEPLKQSYMTMRNENEQEIEKNEVLPETTKKNRCSPVVLQMESLRANLSPEVNMFNFKTHKKSADLANSERPTIDTSNAKNNYLTKSLQKHSSMAKPEPPFQLVAFDAQTPRTISKSKGKNQNIKQIGPLAFKAILPVGVGQSNSKTITKDLSV